MHDFQHTVNILWEFNGFTKWMSKPVLGKSNECL